MKCTHQFYCYEFKNWWYGWSVYMYCSRLLVKGWSSKNKLSTSKLSLFCSSLVLCWTCRLLSSHDPVDEVYMCTTNLVILEFSNNLVADHDLCYRLHPPQFQPMHHSCLGSSHLVHIPLCPAKSKGIYKISIMREHWLSYYATINTPVRPFCTH